MDTKLKQFNIYQPLNGALNITCSIEGYVYELIGSIKAENLVRSFYMSQNDFNPAYAQYGKRSVSVGDIITDGMLVHMVLPSGFKKLKTKDLLYKEIMELDEAVIDILDTRIKLDDETMDQLLDNCYE